MPARVLKLSAHAEQRAHFRGISHADILRCIRTGERTPDGGRVLHYMRRFGLGVIVDWRDLVVVTVMWLNEKTYNSIKQKEIVKWTHER